MEDTLHIQDKIKNFILKTSYVSNDLVNNDTLLFTQGIMDSMGFVYLINFIEVAFSVKASDNELLDSNFESIDAITRFIEKKMNQN